MGPHIGESFGIDLDAPVQAVVSSPSGATARQQGPWPQ
jgi:hypothetical protein